MPQPDRKNQKNPILENYIFHTFQRLAWERNNLQVTPDKKNTKIFIKDDKACFNTGLFTKNYQPIYGYFEKNDIPEKQHWVLKGFFDDYSFNLSTFEPLPVRAEYFNDIGDLIYDTKLSLRVQISHILDNPENKSRLPEELQEAKNLTILFDGAIKLAEKKIQANYKVAVPQYYQNNIQILIPISLRDPDIVDLALTVSKSDAGYYSGSTCLTMDMAYNNARLIARPDSDWLKP